jgi:D-sedoheptulose 7-phosphate isomerase
MPVKEILDTATRELASLMPVVNSLAPNLQNLADAMFACWDKRGKVLTCGNGGSAADAMHLAEELIARFQKNRKALAAIALCDPTVLTCAANDFGYETVFSRQIEALGNPGDILIVFTTSGNSPNLIRAVETAKSRGVTTASFLGKDGGQLKGACAIELHVPTPTSHRTQECHMLLYHTLCEYVDSKL